MRQPAAPPILIAALIAALFALLALAAHATPINDRVRVGIHPPSVQLDVNDTVKVCLGSDCDYWMVYASGSTRWELWTTDADGGGTDGILMQADDGQQVVGFPGGHEQTRSYTFSSIVSSGVHYMGGSYSAPAAHAALDQGTLTVTYGNAADTEPWGAHAFLVADGAGTVDAGTVSIVVSGTSVTDAGVRVNADTETIVADITATVVDVYVETDKKWLGQITYTLTPAGATNFASTFNYGFSAYTDMNNHDFIVTGALCEVHAGSTNTLDIELLHHTTDGSGWTYSAAAFVPGNTPIVKMSDTYDGPETTVRAGFDYRWKRTPLSTAVTGSANGGIVWRVTTGGANTVEFMNCHLTSKVKD